MKILLLTYGSRGDVQPMLALARALQNAGHTATLALPATLNSFAAAYGVPTLALPGDPAELSRGLNQAGGNYLRQVQAMRKSILPIAAQVAEAAWQAVQQAELLVHTFAFTNGAHAFARQRGIPDISAQFFPIFAPTAEFPPISLPALFQPGSRLARGYNLAAHRFGEGVYRAFGELGYLPIRQANRHYPRRLGWPFAPSAGRPATPLLFAFRPQVLARPDDWPAHCHLTGYWFLDEPEYTPPPELEAFLTSGPAPVCLGFGSMIHPRAAEIQGALLESLQALGQRAVILTGWDGWREARPAQHDPKLLFLEGAAHSWLLPRCRFNIHHGGAGTTAAALRAGRPQMVVPLAADQPFWGERVYQIGAGPQPQTPSLKRSEPALDKARLRAAMETALSSEAMQARAAALGQAIGAENGLAQAVQRIDAYAGGF